MFRRLLLIMLLSLPPMASATGEARVVEVGGGEVTLEFDGAPGFAVGDTLELTYQAGFMDMLLGSYRLRERQGNRLILSTLSTSNPPGKGMRVGVQKAAPILFSGQPLPGVSAQSPPPPAPGEGRVVAVHGGEVELEFPPGTQVQVGDLFSLAFEAPRVGRVSIQGVWQVRRVDANRAHADAKGPAGQARTGQVAIPVAPISHSPPTTQSPPLSPQGPDKGGLFPNPPPGGFDEFLAGKPPPPPATPGPAASWIGLHMQGLTPELAQTLNLPTDSTGILVAEVVAGGPAERAGLQAGDVILDVDGRSLAPHQLAERIRQSAPGTLLRLRIGRDGKRMFIAVRTAAKP